MVLGVSLWTVAMGGDRAPALYEAWRWVHFTTDSGLPSNQVLQVVETPAGTVWAATQRGLAWYDDYRWHAIREGDGIPERASQQLVPLPDDSVLAVMDGRLYIGDANGSGELERVARSRREIIVGVRDGKDRNDAIAVVELREEKKAAGVAVSDGAVSHAEAGKCCEARKDDFVETHGACREGKKKPR